MHVQASTSASRLWAAVVERVMTPAVDGGLAAMTTTSHLWAVVAEVGDGHGGR